MKTEISIWLILLLAVFTGLNGCMVAATGPNPGSVAYVEGTLEVMEQAEYERVWGAAVQGAGAQGLTITRQTDQGGRGRIVAVAADGRTVTINVERVYSMKTAMTISVSNGGDRDRSLEIYNAIKAAL